MNQEIQDKQDISVGRQCPLIRRVDFPVSSNKQETRENFVNIDSPSLAPHFY